jgi:hypothetical protein
MRLHLLARRLHGGETVIADSETVIADKDYAGHDLQAAVAQLGAAIIRPNPRPNPGKHRSSPASDNAPSRSSEPPKAHADSNPTAPARCATSASGSASDCSRSQRGARPGASDATPCSVGRKIDD